MPNIITAALLGRSRQSVTEFLPVSSTAHLLIAGRLLGYDDPGGVFTVMIQLGSIVAIMWLYRDRILAILRGLSSDPDARHFALMIVLATVPLLLAGGLLSKFVKRVLYGNFGVMGAAFTGRRDHHASRRAGHAYTAPRQRRLRPIAYRSAAPWSWVAPRPWR